jgi:hypothetical protein
MRRVLGAVALAVAVSAGTAYGLAVSQAVPAEVVTVEERGGIIRVDPATHDWFILDTTAHRNEGLTGVDCSPSNGALTVTFVPLTNLITAFVDEDESYAGQYEGGVSLGLDRFVITIHRSSNGAVVPCNAAELRINNSNFWLWVKGRVIVEVSPTTQPATTAPTTPPTTPPMTLPTTTAPTPPPIG